MFDFPVISCPMEKVTTKLKSLRKSAVPRLTVRAMADALDMPLGTYARYESSFDYKKPFLPLDLTRKIASVLGQRGVDTIDVLKLAGLDGLEAEPEARAVEAARPAIQYVSLQVALPSESALREMFAKLLVLVPEGSSRDETAEILARWLPSGFAGIGPYLPDPGAGVLPSVDVLPRSAATTDLESPRP
jgi:hypothetical protein